jgi:hypothetical protein
LRTDLNINIVVLGFGFRIQQSIEVMCLWHVLQSLSWLFRRWRFALFVPSPSHHFVASTMDQTPMWCVEESCEKCKSRTMCLLLQMQMPGEIDTFEYEEEESLTEEEQRILDCAGELVSIGDVFRWERADLHERTLRAVLSALLDCPEMIGAIEYQNEPQPDPNTYPPSHYFTYTTLLFRDGEHRCNPNKRDPLPNNSFRIAMVDGVPYKIETQYDEGWGRYNLGEIDEGMQKQCMELITTVEKRLVH